MGEALFIFVFLMMMSICDIRSRRVPLPWLTAASFVVCVYTGIRFFSGEVMNWTYAAGLLPGVFFLLAAWGTGKIGYGDGWILLLLGLMVGYRQCIAVFLLSLLLISGISIILLAAGRVKRNSRLPYIPFLAAAFLMGNGMSG